MGMVADYKPFTSKTGKLIPAKASKKSGHEIGPESRRIQKRKFISSACPLGLCVPGDSYAIFFLFLKSSKSDDENLKRGPFGRATGFSKWSAKLG